MILKKTLVYHSKLKGIIEKGNPDELWLFLKKKSIKMVLSHNRYKHK